MHPFPSPRGFRPRSGALALATLLALSLAMTTPAVAGAGEAGSGRGGAEQESGRGSLEPSYEPRPAPEPEIYTTDYLFSLSRAVSNSTLVPAARVPVFFLTFPLDVAFLPVALIAGFFPGE